MTDNEQQPEVASSLLSRVAGNFSISERIVSDGGSNKFKLCDANPNRIELSLFTDLATSGFASMHTDPSFAGGYFLANGSGKEFFINHHGPMVQQAWFYLAGAIPANIYVVEVLSNKG